MDYHAAEYLEEYNNKKPMFKTVQSSHNGQAEGQSNGRETPWRIDTIHREETVFTE